MKSLVATIRLIVGFIVLLLLTALSGLIAWGSRGLYEHEKTSVQFEKEGHPVSVEVISTDRHRRVWYDQFRSTVYITFNYQSHPYTVRYIQDSGWISAGDKVHLLYHPQRNEFIQGGNQLHFARYTNHSRLMDFTIVSVWTDEHKWLVYWLGFTILTGLLGLMAIGTIIRTTWMQKLWGIIGMLVLLAMSVYFTYNTWMYFRYYNALKAGGKETTVKVLYLTYHSWSRKNDFWFRDYRAEVETEQGIRYICISEDDYDRLKPNDRLAVLYNRDLNDLMPVDYSPDYKNVPFVFISWFIFIYLLYKYFLKRKKEALISG